MSSKLLSILPAFLILFGIATGAERIETHEWPVGDAPIVKVETFKGTIRVEPSTSGKLELVMEAQASGSGAESWLDRLSIKARPFGAGLVVAVKQDGLGVEFSSNRSPERNLSLVLRVPQPCTLDLKSESGHIEVGNDFQGNTRARVTSGDIFIGRVDGSVNAVTRSGNVTISRVSGDVTARSYFGDLHVGNVRGQATLRADHGSIDVVNSFGGLDAEAVRGDITAGMGSEFLADSRLVSSVGDVIVDVDPESSFEVRAETSWGRVNSALAFDQGSEKSGKNRLTGMRNGGGAVLALRAKGGDVHIKSMPSYGM